jgi:GNAT superfamily N-acetyltransferase
MTIQPMTLDDVPAVALLCGQLGYGSSENEVAVRLREILTSTEEALFSAVEDGNVTGWTHVRVSRTLTSDSSAEIIGLVVADTARRSGVGRALVEHIEGWALQRGIRRVRVRCAVSRADAHAFYRALGYEPAKRQEVFDKRLDGAG